MPRRTIHRRRRAQGGCLSFAIAALTVVALALVMAIVVTNRLKSPADNVGVQVAGKRDVAWYICYYPKDNPKYVVGSCIEQGGGGGEVAGPPAAYTLGALLALERGEELPVGPVAASTGKSVPFDSNQSASRTV